MPSSQNANKPVDGIQQCLAEYACRLDYAHLSPDAIHAAKVRVIDTLGALMGGFFGEPCRIARNLAARMQNAGGATVIGTRMRTDPGMAAFVNASTARYVEMTDGYHWPGSSYGHPSDTLTPVFAVAEHAEASGRELITAIVLAYEIFLRVNDAFRGQGFDNTNFACLGTALAAGRLLGLSPGQLAQCISMAVVPNNILRQARTGHLSMFKAVAAGHAGRAGVFAALQARAGMEGPLMPFEGKAGWCDHIAGARFSLDTLGGKVTPFKILDTRIKHRPSSMPTLASVLAAEKMAAIFKDTTRANGVIVEVYKKSKEAAGSGEQHWNPDSRETADHSVPYVVAATLLDGTITPRSFDDAHLWNPKLRALMQKITVVENQEFTQHNEQPPVRHRARITVVTQSGERLVEEAGGDKGDLSAQTTDEEIMKKFYGLTGDVLERKRVEPMLDRLWRLEDMGNVADVPAAFVAG